MILAIIEAPTGVQNAYCWHAGHASQTLLDDMTIQLLAEGQGSCTCGVTVHGNVGRALLRVLSGMQTAERGVRNSATCYVHKEPMADAEPCGMSFDPEGKYFRRGSALCSS